MLRQKDVLFWSLAFPFLLSTLFTLAFANLYTTEKMPDTIKLAYVAPQRQNPLFNLESILGGIGNQENKLFDLVKATEDEARDLVKSEEVAAAVFDGNEPQLFVKEVSADQVVIKQVTDQILSTRNTVSNLMRANPLTPMGEVITQLNEADYVTPHPLGNERMTPDIVYFYALLAMTCLGACSAGAVCFIQQQANKSAQGARAAVSSANKWARFAAWALASYLVQVVMSLVVLLYMRYGLGKEFGTQWGYLLSVLALGTLMGFLMGMAVASILRGSLNVVVGITSGVYLLSSFLTGLMSDQVKRLVDTQYPLISRINPGSMIVDALYSLYYYQQADLTYLYRMVLACLVFLVFITLSLGRRYHDSI